jgi:hypothetical protein
MKYIRQIENNVKKIRLLGELYENILDSEITTEQEIEILKLKAKVAKQEMLHLIYEIHKIINELKN